ncbi:MAG: FG-GAP-like repeat-containing protein [Acidobacteria bacterium]|nr:FG-GAP-like repeat-containing protein [Acidobacteriota bacterium]
MTRRHLFALSCLFASPARAESITYRNNPPYFPYLPLIESGHDEFPPDPPMPVYPPRRDGRFADITGTVLNSDQLSKGIPYWMASLDASSGIDIYGNNGIAVGDIDNDGRDEIYVCQPSGLRNLLFRWQEGKLVEVSAGVDIEDDTSSALFLDLRNIGRQDLIVLRGSGPLLFLNDGKGNFTPVPDAFRFAQAPQGGFTGMAAADYDRDGKLDLYLCTYSFFQTEAQFRYPVPYFDAQNGPANFLFRNRLNADGSGYFEDTTLSSGINENNNRYSFAPAWCDYDGSGWPSLYVANDFGRNNLYQNQRGQFRDVAAASGVEDIGPGMSAAWFDQDGDGRPDLYVANMWTAVGQQIVRHKNFPHPFNDAWRGHTKGNSFYRNLGGGKFQAETRGIEMGRWGWSADAADFDNDGRSELFLTCGMMTGPKQPDLMGFFWRQVVAKTPATAIASGPYENGWNAINQFIREGYSWNGNEPNVFYAPDGDTYRDASVESGLAFAGDSRAFAITDIDGDGCLDLLVKSRLGPQLRVFQNRAGQARQRIAFRLIGTKSNRDAIGARITVDGQTKWITAGSGYLSQHAKTLHFGLSNKTTAESISILWPSGLEQKLENLTANAVYEIREGGPVERRPFSAPAVPLPEPGKVPGLFTLRTASPDLLAAYSLFRRYLFEYRAPLEVPLSLLLNAEGHAIKIYAKPPSAEQVRADMATPRPPAKARRDFFKLGASLLWCGYPEQALPYLEAVLRRQPANIRTMVLVAQIHREANRLDKATGLLEEALRLDPRSAEAWNEFGGVAMAREDYKTALQYFEQALAAKSGLAYVLLNAAQASDKLDKLPQAEAFFRKALELEPANADGHNGLGLTLAKRNNSAEAERSLLEAVRLKPSLSAAWNNLGILYLQARDPAKAIRALEQGIAAAPGDELLYLNLGRVFVQLKRMDDARNTMQRLLKVQPDSRVARKALEDLSKAK